MLILSFDTSANFVSVAISDENKVYAQIQQEMERGHAEALMPIIDETFKKTCLSLENINAIAVTTGPGSFTGIRVGLASARAFGMVLKIPVHGITCFEANSCFANGSVTVVLDTKREDYYTQQFDEDHQPLSQPKIQTAEDLKANLPFVAIGSGALRLSQEIGCTTMDMPCSTAVAVAKVAFQRINAPSLPKPLYLRDADVTV